MEGAFPAGPKWAPGFGRTALAALLLAAGCTPYIGTTASSFLRRVQTDPDPNIRYLAYTKLAQPRCYDNEAQKTEAVKALLEKLKSGTEPIATRAVILHTLGELRDPAAHDAVLLAVNDNEPTLRVQACRALGKVGREEDATVLARVMTVDTLEDCRVAAIDSLGELKVKDPRITRMLVAGMEDKEPGTRLASLEALRKITGRDLGTDVEPWAKLMMPDAKSDKPQIASPSAAPAASSALTQTYPPRPVALPSADLSVDPASGPPPKTTALSRAQAIGAAANQKQPLYPAHNPNLPTVPSQP